MFLILAAPGLWAQEVKEHQEISQYEIQDQHQEEGEHSEHHNFRHSIALMLGHAHIFQGRDLDGVDWIRAISVALDYNFHINGTWSIGWHNDIILQDFLVESHIGGGSENKILEREHPIASLVVGTYKITHKFGIMLGAGGEFAPEENLFMSRIGGEFTTPFRDESWEFVVGLTYDIKWDAYDCWNLGVGVAKRF